MSKYHDVAPLPFLIQGFGWGYAYRNCRSVWQFRPSRVTDQGAITALLFDTKGENYSGWMIADPRSGAQLADGHSGTLYTL